MKSASLTGQALGALSTWLKGAGALGYATLGLCIFVTTIPPLPLYSTLIILSCVRRISGVLISRSGYTFGALRGCVTLRSCPATCDPAPARGRFPGL